MTVPLPFECETFASPELPLVGLAVNIDTQMLQDLLIDIGDDDYLMQPRAESNGVNLAELTEALLCATERLLDVMAKPLDARVLGPQIVREILYYVLRGTPARRCRSWSIAIPTSARSPRRCGASNISMPTTSTSSSWPARST